MDKMHNTKSIIWFLFLILGLLVDIPIMSEPRVNVNFQDTDIRLMIQFIGKIAQKDVVIDENVSGTVTVLSHAELENDQALDLLFKVLTLHGYVYYEDDHAIRVMSKEKAVTLGEKTNVGNVVDSEFPGKFVTQIVPLSFAQADEVKEVLVPLLGRGASIYAYAKRNALILNEESDHLKSLLSIIEFLDHATQEGDKEIKVYHLTYAKAENLIKILSAILSTKNEKELENQSEVKMVEDALSNSIVVYAPPSLQQKIPDLLKQLDLQRQQILVEVLIAEVDVGKGSEWGIDWLAVEGVVYGTQRGFGSPNVNKVGDIENYVLTGGGSQDRSAAFLYDTKKVGSVEIPRLGAIITAFQNDKNVNILSTPQILTMDHEEAEILVGENRAFIQNTQITAEGGTVRTFEFKDVGLLLRIKPHIMHENHIEMEVYQKVEDVIGQSFEGAVETSKREARTTVMIKNGDVAVIGGLIREQTQEKVNKVPVLGNIPLLGYAFRNIQKENKKTNLFIFISPRIIKDRNEMKKLTTDKQHQVGIVPS